MPAQIVLASASPRRRALLDATGLTFQVDAAGVPEVRALDEAPAEFARRVARDKAQAVAARHPQAVVLGADTIVVIDGEVLGKPRDEADACRMLRQLSGRSHQVMTAVVLALPDGRRDELVEVTWVTFRALDSAEIDAYVATGEPFDKAGAYAIQGGAAGFVTEVVGSYSNVVGLPVEALLERLQRHFGIGVEGGTA
jgi:septum formation protein